MAINAENFDEVLFVNASIGSDDYNGTIDNPYKTIATAISNSTGNNVLINIGKGIYEVKSIIDMSKANKIMTFVGKSKDTTLRIKYVYSPGYFYGALNIYNLIVQPADDISGDTRVLSYSGDSIEVNYYNCVFIRSSNGRFPTNGLMYTSGSGSANMNKNLYNCSIKGITQICESGGLKVVNCCTDSDTLKGYLTIVDCLAGVTYDSKYKTGNNNYGVYSGDNGWKFLKMLLYYDSKYHTYDASSNSIVDFTDDVSTEFNNDNNDSFITDLNQVKDLIDLKANGVKVISNKNFKSKIKSIKTTKQLFFANGDFSTRIANNIDYFKFNYVIPDGTIIKTVVSINSGNAWYTYDGAWTQLDNIVPIKDYSELSSEEKIQWNTFLDEVLTKGINVQDVNTLDFNTLNSEKIRFAYAIKISDANANTEAILKDLKWQFDSIGSYEQLSPKTDVNISITNEAIKIQPLKNMELIKINVSTPSQFSQPQKENEILNKFNINDNNKLTWNNSILYTEEDINALNIKATNIIVDIKNGDNKETKTLQEVLNDILANGIQSQQTRAVCGTAICGTTTCGDL